MINKALFVTVVWGLAGMGGCGEPGSSDSPMGDVPRPRNAADSEKADGLGPRTCKAPLLAEPLSSPEITISIADPPMVRLRDLDTGMVKYYPAGVGVKKNGVSRSWEPVQFSGGQTRFSVNPQAPEAGCRTREWINPADTSDRAPLYAGLPWMTYRGYYAIHGPIDEYWNADGGTLNPGYVSHGCVRMDSRDIRELYAHIKHLTDVPLILTKDGFGDEAASQAFGAWVNEPCQNDHECRRITDGFCRKAAGDDAAGVCSARCARYCPDRVGAATTFCIADPRDASSGYCVTRALDGAAACGDELLFAEQAARFNEPEVKRDVCTPTFE